MGATLKKAFKLSIEAWGLRVKNNGEEIDFSESHPHIHYLLSHCGLCEYYDDDDTGDFICKNCPLNTDKKIDGAARLVCCGGLYNKWDICKTERNAQAILDLIKKKYAAHLKRYYKGSTK